MGTTRRTLRKPLLVCVDDDPEILRSLRRVFRGAPYDLLMTEQPADVLQWICDRKVDLIIADQRMPDMNGTDLLQVVQDYSPGTACMILSGFPDTALIVEQSQLRIEKLLSKPWDNDQLLETVRRILAEDRLKPAAATGAVAPTSTPPAARPEIIIDCAGTTARDVIARILPACTQARADGTTAVIVLRNLSFLNDSLSRLLKGLARAVAWSQAPIDLRDDSGCVAAFVAALSRSSSVR
jgi:DNA-binding NarL/FixJ family response regulator